MHRNKWLTNIIELLVTLLWVFINRSSGMVNNGSVVLALEKHLLILTVTEKLPIGTGSTTVARVFSNSSVVDGNIGTE